MISRAAGVEMFSWASTESTFSSTTQSICPIILRRCLWAGHSPDFLYSHFVVSLEFAHCLFRPVSIFVFWFSFDFYTYRSLAFWLHRIWTFLGKNFLLNRHLQVDPRSLAHQQVDRSIGRHLASVRSELIFSAEMPEFAQRRATRFSVADI